MGVSSYTERRGMDAQTLADVMGGSLPLSKTLGTPALCPGRIEERAAPQSALTLNTGPDQNDTIGACVMAETQPTNEQWRDIPEWEGLYQVSDLGRVRSLDRVTPGKDGANRPFRGRLLKPRPQRFGHLKVVLYSGNGQKRQRYVHQLVLEAFVGKRPDGAITCHNNGDPSDNRVENLRWGTHSENTADRISHGTDPNLRKTHCPQGHEYVQENIVYGSHGERTCRTCRNARNRIAMRRKRALVK